MKKYYKKIAEREIVLYKEIDKSFTRYLDTPLTISEIISVERVENGNILKIVNIFEEKINVLLTDSYITFFKIKNEDKIEGPSEIFFDVTNNSDNDFKDYILFLKNKTTIILYKIVKDETLIKLKNKKKEFNFLEKLQQGVKI